MHRRAARCRCGNEVLDHDLGHGDIPARRCGTSLGSQRLPDPRRHGQPTGRLLPACPRTIAPKLGTAFSGSRTRLSRDSVNVGFGIPTRIFDSADRVRAN